MSDLEFGAWDIYEDNAYEAARKAAVLDAASSSGCASRWKRSIRWRPYSTSNYVRLINGPNVKEARTRMDKAEMLMDDIRRFRERTGVARCVMVWTGSTEVLQPSGGGASVVESF